MKHIRWCVHIDSEFYQEELLALNDIYFDWFDTRKQAIDYARKIKKEIKEDLRHVKDNTITIDVDKYYTTDGYDEDFGGVNYSLNIVGRW